MRCLWNTRAAKACSTTIWATVAFRSSWGMWWRSPREGRAGRSERLEPVHELAALLVGSHGPVGHGVEDVLLLQVVAGERLSERLHLLPEDVRIASGEGVGREPHPVADLDVLHPH